MPETSGKWEGCIVMTRERAEAELTALERRLAEHFKIPEHTCKRCHLMGLSMRHKLDDLLPGVQDWHCALSWKLSFDDDDAEKA